MSDTNLFLDFWAKSIKFDSESGGWWVVVGCFFCKTAGRRSVACSLAHSHSSIALCSFTASSFFFLLSSFRFLLLFCCFFVAFSSLIFMRPACRFVSSGRVGSGRHLKASELRALLVPFHSIFTGLRIQYSTSYFRSAGLGWEKQESNKARKQQTASSKK